MLLYFIALGLILFDQLTKFLILGFLSGAESAPVLPGIFHLSLVHNAGIAFGLFQNNPYLLTIIISLCVLVLIFYSGRIRQKGLLEQIAYGLILGGAIGNLIDRFRFGWVVDFLDFRIWPVFNVADSAITVGVILFAWKIIFSSKSHESDQKNSGN